jgi:signal transduction histidine kinase
MHRTNSRTPLAAICGIGEVGLQRDGTREEYRELVGRMLEEVNCLTRLVDELLLISRGDSGAIRLNYSAVGIFELVHETVALLEPVAEEKQPRLVPTGDVHVTIHADAVFLRQAIVNVVRNAIKYSPPRATTSLSVEKANPYSIAICTRCRPVKCPRTHGWAMRIFRRRGFTLGAAANPRTARRSR